MTGLLARLFWRVYTDCARVYYQGLYLWRTSFRRIFGGYPAFSPMDIPGLRMQFSTGCHAAVVYDRPLSAVERSQVENYLMREAHVRKTFSVCMEHKRCAGSLFTWVSTREFFKLS